MTAERYTHGHHAAVLANHSARTAQNSAAFLLDRLQPGQRLLDVGCGPGTITVDLAALLDPGEVIGVDNVAGVLDKARAYATERGRRNVRFEQGDAYALPFDADSFDVVYAHQVLQHVARPVDALREMFRVLRPGGLVAVRDADYGTMIHAPTDPRIDLWLELYHTVARSNGGEPDAGRFLRAWVAEAGFVDAVTTATAWCYADADRTHEWGSQWASRVSEGAFADQAVASGASSVEEIGELSAAWTEWSTKPTAFFAFLHGEVLAAKP